MLSLGIGIFSLCLAGNITRSALDLSERTITIPSYDEIIKNNEKDSELKKEEHIDTIGELKEIQDINKETDGIEKAVKVSNNTAEEDEKAITFTAPCEGDIIKIFSIDKPLKSKTMGDFRTHNGIDIKSDLGSSVYASADGVVDKIYDDNLLGIACCHHVLELRVRHLFLGGGTVGATSHVQADENSNDNGINPIHVEFRHVHLRLVIVVIGFHF